MSIQSEINRINSNVQAALNAVADTGVSVPENANSNDLPAAVLALANEKQDKLTFDATPTANSTNPVTSGGVKTELDKKASATSLGAHTGNTDNPHGVTAAQVGAYTKDETNTLLQNKTNIEIGSYVGTGTYGADNQTSITLPFVPKFIYIAMVQSDGSPRIKNFGFLTEHSSVAYVTYSKDMERLIMDAWGKTVSWHAYAYSQYADDSDKPQYDLNVSGETYYYYAFS